ncbi:LIM-domain binding protein-domain-containing protein [Rhodofomes roseus]|uniref:LIM-domain binding protein-domain-containing protein n=1 Tax=Rhodofomes roseus TaxID=34475 RepID=A0ABQ8KY22_9APHY|nr:LIM-domain binding protein-domain-containing protein [Rhodofomes roseus]KAH9843790.1 LIM-domain binding protein-domain-containing protein [Rhodofomes roseus]
MNVVPGGDLLRPGVPPLAPSMLNMNTHNFMAQQQHHPQGQPPQGHPSQMGLLQNNPNPNAMLAGGQPNNAGNNPSTMYQLQIQQANQFGRQQVLMQQAQSSQNGLSRAGPQQLNGHGGHNPPHPGMGFTNGMMGPQQQQQMRRVASQPTLNQAGGHMGGMPQGMAGMGMGLNPGQNLAQHMRPPIPQSHLNNMRVQQPPQHPMQGHISPDMQMSMNRPPQIPGSNGLPPHRTTSAQPHMMNNLGQPSGMPQQQHPGGMQGPMHQSAFNSAMLQHHQPPQLPGASPHPGAHSQNHTPANFGPNMPMGNGPPSQPPANRQQPPGDNGMLMGFPNPPMQPNLPQVPRIPQTVNPFPFGSSSTSPNPPGDMSQNVGGGQMNGPGPGPGQHPQHLPTPAQLVDRMNPSTNDNFPSQYNLQQSQANVPTRPPSQQHAPHPGFSLPPQQPPHPHHQSPRPADPMNQHMAQRPRSQQGQQRQSPPQPGSSRTPRVSQQPLPNNMIPPRIPMPPGGPNPPGPSQQPQPAQPPTQGAPGAPAPSAHPVQIAPRQQPGPPGPSAPPPTASGPAQGQPDGPPHHPPQPPQSAGPPPQAAPPQVSRPVWVLGAGQAISRLVSMSGDMAMNRPSRELPYWESFVRKYFMPKATMKITLWKDNQRQEAKPFEIGTPILPRFFQVTTQSGVQSMSLSLDGARERATNNVRAVVECPDALWTFRYLNGYTVVLKGPFTANVVAVTEPQMQNYTLRIESLIFDALTHEKLINIDSIEGTRIASSPAASQGMGDVDPRYEEPRTVIERASFPAEPINAFGIPQATMRCLELAESVTQMGDLIQFSASQQMGPKEALSRYAERLRENYRQATAGEFKPDLGPKSNLPGRPGPGTNALDGVNGGVPPTPPSSMYPGTPSSSSMQQGQAPPTPQNPPHAEPGKQGKGSQQQASSQNMVSTPASASTPAAAQTPGGPTTPAMASAPLKRKAGQRAEPESPALANSATDPQPPPAKRPTRKRPRTGTQGGG